MNPIEAKTIEFEHLCDEIKKGKKGSDFMIEGEENGIDCYKDTPLERNFVKLSRTITGLITGNPEHFTVALKKRIILALENTSKARGSFRGRTPACGGDWQDIDSPVKWEIENHLNEFL